MVETNNKGIHNKDTTPLPVQQNKLTRTIDGVEFDPNELLWELKAASFRNGTFNFKKLSKITSPRFLFATQHVAKLLVTTGNLQTSYSIYIQFRLLVENTYKRTNRTIDALSAEDIAIWVTDSTSHKFRQAKMFIDLAIRARQGLLDEDAASFVGTIISRSDKSAYEDVRTWSPINGPYRPAEDVVLKGSLDDAYNQGELPLYHYTLIRVIRGFGIRPYQAALLKVCDIRQSSNGGAQIHISKVKQRNVPPRGEFMPWKLVANGLYNLIKLHINSNIAPLLDAGSRLEDAPLFYKKRAKAIHADESLDAHTTAGHITKLFTRFFNQTKPVISPLTGKQIVATPRRERHTVLTGLAMDGCSADEIAANAGQSHPSSCEPYVDASIDHFQRMERLVGEKFIPIADRFLGKVVKAEADNANPDSIVYSDSVDALGSCDSGGCNAIDAGVAPYACYICRKFNAWADAPHNELLDMLQREQQNLYKRGHSEVAETKTAIIVAIYDLIEAIREMECENG